jgi:hypothetical protein
VFGNDPIGVSHGQGRLSSPQAWSALHNAAGQWWQINAGGQVPITGVVVQSRRNSDQRVTKFHVKHSLDGSTWLDVDGGAHFVVATGTPGPTTNKIDGAVFENPVMAQYIRIIVLEWVNHISMRAALTMGKNCASQYGQGAWEYEEEDMQEMLDIQFKRGKLPEVAEEEIQLQKLRAEKLAADFPPRHEVLPPSTEDEAGQINRHLLMSVQDKDVLDEAVTDGIHWKMGGDIEAHAAAATSDAVAIPAENDPFANVLQDTELGSSRRRRRRWHRHHWHIPHPHHPHAHVPHPHHPHLHTPHLHHPHKHHLHHRHAPHLHHRHAPHLHHHHRPHIHIKVEDIVGDITSGLQSTFKAVRNVAKTAIKKSGVLRVAKALVRLAKNVASTLASAYQAAVNALNQALEAVKQGLKFLQQGGAFRIKLISVSGTLTTNFLDTSVSCSAKIDAFNKNFEWDLTIKLSDMAGFVEKLFKKAGEAVMSLE